MVLDSAASLILPDSRTKAEKGIVNGYHPYFGQINWTPVFCANCGKPHGYIPEQNMDFACYLCDACSSHWGTQFGMALMPDEIFWQQVHAEMIEQYGRVLTPAEVESHMQYDCNPLSKLIRQGA